MPQPLCPLIRKSREKVSENPQESRPAGKAGSWIAQSAARDMITVQPVMGSSEPAACRICGSRIRAGSPVAVCSRCLLADAVNHSRLWAATNIATPASHRDLPGLSQLQPLFPDLEFRGVVGAGGMGAVYEAQQIALDRTVAVKILCPPTRHGDAFGGAEFVERFRREAKAMARLSHPNIVGIYDSGERGPHHYLLMEFVDGTDLQGLMDSGALELNRIMEIVPQICDALHYAHQAGVTHRDIKPSNILIDHSGTVKITDFGLAQLLQSPATELPLTRHGQFMGTPFYMAPEQLTSPDGVDSRADIYSLGVVFYQILTRRLPQGNFAPPSFHVPGLSANLDRAVMKALAQDPAQRFRNVGEMRNALGTEQTGPAAPRKRLNRRKLPAQLLGLAALVYGGLLWQPWRQPVQFPGQSLEAALQDAPQATSIARNSTAAPALSVPSPDLATPDHPFVNSLGMRFVPVPGSQALFCIHEIRWKDYAAYANAVPGPARAWQSQTLGGFQLRDRPEDHPVANVSWSDAVAFCAWLACKEGRAYRLPTDHEWSTAVGIGNQENPTASPESKHLKINGEFPWGPVWPPPAGAGNYSDQSRKAWAPSSHPSKDYIENYDDGFPTTAPVMSFAPNRLGIYDLGGDVWEWVQDALSEGKTLHVLRGGSYNFHAKLSSCRFSREPDHRSPDAGFRVVLDP